jgi:hypothetical protein
MLHAAALRDDPTEDAPPMSDDTPARQKPAYRAGKTLAGAYIDKTDLFIIQELCLRLGRERGERMTMQEFAVEAFTRECARHGVKLTGKSSGDNQTDE